MTRNYGSNGVGTTHSRIFGAHAMADYSIGAVDARLKPPHREAPNCNELDILFFLFINKILIN